MIDEPNRLELTGIPHRLVISDRGIAAGQLEYKGRRDAEASDLPLDNAVAALISKLGQ